MNNSVDKKRVYHPWNKWEDYNFDFYNNCTGKDKEEKINKAIEMFNSREKTKECMFHVVDNWRFSMEHNLTNSSLNKIADIGQSACAYYERIPSTITMEAWNMLSEEVQNRSNTIAIEAIERWTINNKFIQTCLNLD